LWGVLRERLGVRREFGGSSAGVRREFGGSSAGVWREFGGSLAGVWREFGGSLAGEVGFGGQVSGADEIRALFKAEYNSWTQ